MCTKKENKMGLYRILGLAALGIGSYALYRSGALNPVLNKASCAGNKVSAWAENMVTKGKNTLCSCKTKETEEQEVVS